VSLSLDIHLHVLTHQPLHGDPPPPRTAHAWLASLTRDTAARSKTQCQLLAGRIRLMRNKRQVQVGAGLHVVVRSTDGQQAARALPSCRHSNSCMIGLAIA